MKTKKFYELLTIIAAIVILIIIVASSTVATKAYADGSTLVLNEKKQVYNVSDEQWFYYTPEDSCYYVAETSGGLDTVLRVGNAYFEIVNDNITPSNPNSRIYFKAEEGRQFRVDVRFCYSYSNQYSLLQLRRQRFSMFGYTDKNGNNSAKDFDTPIDKFRDFYECASYENAPAYIVFNDDNRGLAPLNSEVFFFSGHGYEDGSGVTFYQYDEKVGDLTVDDPFFNMDKTRVAMWAACCSANEPDSSPCIARKSVLTGAGASVGFKKEVTFASSRKFTNKFFSVLASGGTVAEAASAGKGAIIWAWDNAKKYVLFGDRNIRLTDQTISGEEFYSLPANYEYLREELANGYVAEPLDGNDTRYYQTINGYQTDSYIDITEVNGRITAFDDHRKTYDGVLGIDENYLNKGCEESVCADGQVYTMREEDEEHIVYCNLDGVMTPVKVSFVVYTGTNGEVYCEANCINLNDGSSIDYGDICGLKEQKFAIEISARHFSAALFYLR